MGAIFRRATADELELDLIADGVLTSGEVQNMQRQRSGGIFAGLADTAKYAALGVALYFGLPLLGRLVR